MNITIRPLGRGRFAAFLGQRLLCKSLTPFFTAARVLQREGVPEDTLISMTHEGTTVVSMRSTVSEAASKIVVETDSDGPKLKRYRPMSAQLPRQGVRQDAQLAVSSRDAPIYERRGIDLRDLLSSGSSTGTRSTPEQVPAQRSPLSGRRIISLRFLADGSPRP